MDRVPMTGRAPVDVLNDLLGVRFAGVSLWAGKAAKTERRVFLHLGTEDGRFWFAKIADGNHDQLRSEYEALRHVQKLLAGSPYHDACRQAVHYREGIIVQEWRSGVSLREILHAARYRMWQRPDVARQCGKVAEWLAGFHAVGASAIGTPRTISSRGATHGDFKPANILLHGDTALAVVDWELFDGNGVQIHDLFHFLLYFGMTLTAPDRMKGLRLTLFEQSWISQIARGCLWQYLAGSGCTSRMLVDAFKQYIDATLQRRSALGLSNTGYFLHEASRVTASLSTAPYAFEPPDRRAA
jgi:hypothetical protein